jgi:hypothetical protein
VSTGLITFRRGPAARIAVVTVSELSPCPGRVAIVCACVCMRHGCVSTACRVSCVVELHAVWCDPSGAASASCALVRVVGAAEACGSSGRVGQREFVLKEHCLGYKNTMYSSL